MAADYIQTEEELRRVIKQPTSMVADKIRSGPLRPSTSEFLAASRLAFVTTVDEGGAPRLMASGGAPGFVAQDADSELLLPIPECLRTMVAANVAPQPFAGVLLTVPGIRHTLRVNGSASLRDGGAVLAVAPDQSYAHCAKALIRSKLWTATTAPAKSTGTVDGNDVLEQLDDASVAFLGASPFVALGTSDGAGEADVSPRGDPAGFVQVIDERTLFLPERPGNRIADSLRNLIANPRASLLAVVPGDNRTLEIVGDAHITTDRTLRRSAEVNGKAPKLGILIEVRCAHLRTDPSLAVSGAWEQSVHLPDSEVPTIGALVADERSGPSMKGRAAAALTDKFTALDYKFKLY